MAAVLTLLLCHQPADEVERILQLWRRVTTAESILLACGGATGGFAEIAHAHKVYIDDPRLRTRDHQREYQSCSGVMREASRWLHGRRDFDYVHFVEYDHVPLVRDLHERLISRITEERADMLAHHLQRIDHTNHPHYLYHSVDPRFHEFFSGITTRSEPEAVLSMLGTGSFWERSAFEDVGGREEPFPMYFELYLPTLAHHLGYRVRDFSEQNASITNRGDFGTRLEEWRAAGAWMAHPVKNLPEDAQATIR